MIKTVFKRSRFQMRFMASVVACLMILQAGVGGAAIVPPVGLVPLNQVPVPEPSNLFQFVKNKAFATILGKALFWDMQVGSDGMTACATCHFNAGTDNRMKNTVNPGTNDGDNFFDVQGPVTGPNQTVLPTAFPFHQRQAPVEFQASSPIRDSNDVLGSQGVRLAQFVNIIPGSRFEQSSALTDPIFNVGANTRQVTGRNTPSVINAVFNFTNFWDGRASAFFNGVNPFGPLDTTAGIYVNVGGNLQKQKISMEFASLASQAVGPPLSEVEMSFRGRTFPQIGRKMLNLTPLGIQYVHPEDGILGIFANAIQQPNGSLTGGRGLDISYEQLIKAAFHDKYWNSSQSVNLPEGQFSQMEANFSLFWGLAIQLYEATLVSDDTPFDRFLGGDDTALTDQQQDGFNIFIGGAGRCDLCHGGTETTMASTRSAAFVDNTSHALIELMNVASGKQIIYDNGFNNTAVRRTNEDKGRGGNTIFTNPLDGGNSIPLSFSALAELQAKQQLPFAVPILPGNVPPSFPIANDGAFKVPSLRNIELTAPYMHNGGMLTLHEVVDFYVRGGDFPNNNKANLDLNIAEIPAMQTDPATHDALVEFMKSMTDERVRNESYPFDHPELFVPNGDPGTVIRLAPRGMSGEAAPLNSVVSLNPVASPTAQTSQLIGGTKEVGSSVQIQVNGGAVRTADTSSDFAWSTVVSGLLPGNNTITVSATDFAGAVTTLTGNIFVSANITITAGAGPNGSISPAGATTVAGGSNQTYTITPNAGYVVSALIVDGQQLSGATSHTFTNVTGNHYINAYFSPLSHRISAGAGANGNISPAGSTSVTPGSNQTYAITPNSGYVVSALVVDGQQLPGATSHTFTNVTGNHYINAYFASSPHKITAGAGANGGISPAGSTAVTPGSDQTYTITPNSGFMVSALVVDGQQLSGATSHTFTNVTGNHYINAYFAPIPANLSIAAAAGANGAISPAGVNTVAGGANQTFTITPNPGFTVTALVVDGNVLPGSTSYTFNNVSSNHYINAYFANLP